MIPKNRLILLLILTILLCHVFPVAANNQKKLLINNQVINKHLNIKEENGALLIPLKVLKDSFNLDIEWIELIKSINIKLDNKIVKLRVDESKVQIGDQVKELSTPVRMTDGKVYIPLDFIAQILGYKLTWNTTEINLSKPSVQVNDVKYKKTTSGEEIIIHTNKRPRYDIASLQSPERLAIDILDSKLSNKLRDIAVNNGLIFQIRSKQFKTDVVRVVLDLYQPLSYQVDINKVKSGYQLKLKLSPRIIDFSYNKKEESFSILATKELGTYNVKSLPKDNKIIVEFPNVLLDIVKDHFAINNKWVDEVELVQVEENNNTVAKLILTTDKLFKLNIYNDPKNAKRLIIKPNRLKELLDVNYNPKEASVNIVTKEMVSPKSIPLKKGARLVLDFPETIFRKVHKSVEYDEKFIEEVRVSQFNKEVARVVIDLKELVNYELNTIKDSESEHYNTVVKLELPDDKDNKELIDTLNSDKSQQPQQRRDINHSKDESSKTNRLEDVNIVTNGNKIELNVNLKNKSKYRIRKFSYPNRLVIDLPQTINKLRKESIVEPKGIITDVRVSQFSWEPAVTRVVFELPYAIDYKVTSKSLTDQISIKLKTQSEESVLSNRTIVVDAGHGGADPGAIGPTGLMEKDVNLDIAKKLAALLRRSGAKVKMTRKDDRYITLWSRANMANRLDSDIFVSIHSNAHKTKDASGTEVYVYPGSYGDTLVLAKLVQNSLQKEIDLIDRGVRFNELYVLEETTMPSILSEIAFITNRKEEKLLADPDFRQRAALGLYKGIVAFFNRVAKEER